MSDTLEVVILAKDEASSVFKSVGASLGSAFKVGAGIAVAGLAAFTGAMGLALNEAMDAELIQSKLNAVIKSTGGIAGVTADEVNHLASELARTTRFSDDAIVAGQTMLLTFTNIGEDVFPAATAAMLNMGEMFGSVDQAAIQLGKALNDPIEGVSALRRIGVTLTQQQEDMIKHFMEVGDIASAQSVILNELGKEFGGVAQAAGNTLTGKLTILKNRFMDVFEAVGMKLIPVITTIVDILADRFMPIIEDLGAKLTPIFESVLWPIQRLFENLSSGMSIWDSFKALVEDFNVVFEWFLQQLRVSPETADKITDAIRSLYETFFSFLSDVLVPFVKDHWPAIRNAFIAVAAVIGGAALIGGILTLGATLAALFNPITLIIGAVALLAMAWTEDWGGIKTFIVNEVWPLLKIAFQEIKEWLEVAIPKAVVFIRDVWENILVPALAKLEEFWYETLKPALSNLVEWFITHIPDAISALKLFWDDTLMPAFNDLVTFYNDYVKPVLEDIQDMFATVIPIAIDVIVPAIQNGLNVALGRLTSVGAIAWTMLQQVANYISGAFNFAVNIGKTVIENLTNGFYGIINAISSVLNSITNLKNSIGNLGDYVPDFLQSHSPTPFEMGLWGISSALQEVNGEILSFQGGLQGLGGFNTGGQSSQTVNNFNLNVATNTQNEKITSDFEMMRTWAGR